MLSIVLADDTRRYDGRSLETEPLGGTESSVIRFARAMAQRGHDVTCFTNCAAPVAHEGVKWVPLSHAKPETCDVYIPVQHVRLFGLVRRPKRLVVWVLWQPNEYKHYKRLPLFWAYRPVPLLMSHHQRRIYSPLLPRREPHVIIPLGLPDDIRGLPPLPAPPPPQAIFASNPQRNLAGLVRLWAERIFPRRRDAVLHVYGLHAIRAGDDPWQAWSGSLLPAGIPEDARASVRIHATASRDDLMAAIRGARAVLYLGHKVEAFCLTLAEAQAMGVPCVVAPETVLPERVIDGVTGSVRGDPQAFADAALDLFNDDALWRRQHEAALRLQQGISWAEYAQRFEVALLSDMLPVHAVAAPHDARPPPA